MKHNMKKALIGMLAISLGGMVAGSAFAAPPDWSKVPVNKITLFYPGQSTSEWLLSPAHKKGNKQIPKGKSCMVCHEDDEANLGNDIVKGGPLEPNPVPGKQGTIDLKFQAAYDSSNAYFRAQWKTNKPYPGEAHPHLRYDGKNWHQYGHPRLDKVVRDGTQPGIYEERFSMMVDDGKVEGFAQQGCWLTCHDGMRDTKSVVKKEDVLANPLIGSGGLNKKDLRKFLKTTRNSEVWNDTKSKAEVAKIKAEGGFLDLMQWRAHRSNPVGMADDGYVLEYRLSDAGKGPFSKNVNKKTHQPIYMYDSAKVGVSSIRAEDLRKADKPQHLIEGVNTVKFDPKVAWKEGDLIPEYYVRTNASGSAADNADVKGVWKDGVWTVVWVRPLNLSNPDDKMFKAGGSVNVGFAVHDDNITTRGHHVSFVRSLGFGVKADIEAIKVN